MMQKQIPTHPNRHEPDAHPPGLMRDRSPGFATRPDRIQAIPQPSAAQPYFANTVQLKTFDANLNLAFAFAQDPKHAEEALKTPIAHIMMGNQTAKQLLFALAELFQCELHPQRSRSNDASE